MLCILNAKSLNCIGNNLAQDLLRGLVGGLGWDSITQYLRKKREWDIDRRILFLFRNARALLSGSHRKLLCHRVQRSSLDWMYGIDA